MAEPTHDSIFARLTWSMEPLVVPPQWRLAPGTGFRMHIPGCAERRGYINDDGALVMVATEKEEQDHGR